MTTLREAAQQALEAMHCAVPTGKITLADWMKANRDLEAALVEDAMQKFTDVNQELEAALGCDHCNHPLYAATRCRVCGRVTEPVQEPVAWLFTNLQSGDYDFCYQEDEHDHDREMWHKQPLYTAPQQRKPLTEEEIYSLFRTVASPVMFARAVERAHGIGDNT